MSVVIDITAFETATVRYIDFGGLLRPTMGGPDQRLNRLGNRYAVDLVLGEVDSDGEGRIIRQQIIRALHEGAIITLPQDGLTIGSPGNPQVNGSGQTGSTLFVKGLTPGYILRAGQFFSVIIGGRRYLHTVYSDAGANGSGQVGLPITPMLRASPSDSAVVEVTLPKLEGNVVGDVSWVYTQGRGQVQSLTIEEAA